MTAVARRVREVLDWLEAHGSKAVREGMARYGIPSADACGVPVGVLQRKAKELGRDHDLSLGLWATGRYEARLLAAFVGDLERVTAAQMEAWSKDFDSWAVCDTVCLHLFDRAPHAWRKVAPWARREDEFGRRAGFALLAALAVHDRASGDAPFLRALPLLEKASGDERHFVKKGVNWALRAVGQRSPALHAAATDVARRLASSPDPAPRWIGRDALRDLSRPLVLRRIAGRAAVARTRRRTPP